MNQVKHKYTKSNKCTIKMKPCSSCDTGSLPARAWNTVVLCQPCTDFYNGKHETRVNDICILPDCYCVVTKENGYKKKMCVKHWSIKKTIDMRKYAPKGGEVKIEKIPIDCPKCKERGYRYLMQIYAHMTICEYCGLTIYTENLTGIM